MLNDGKRIACKFLKGFASAALVFCAGFGALYFIWRFLNYSNIALPGLFYYRAATIGDGICLPILVGALITYLSLCQKLSKRQRKISFIIGMIFGVIGAIIQAGWLISDDTKLNWTIPRNHYFNLPGWYHSAFFVAMFFILGNLFVKMFFAKKAEALSENTKLKMILQTVIWFAASLFLFMLALDDYSTKENYFWVLLLVLFLISVIASFFNIIVYKSINKYEVSSLLSGVVSAFAIALIKYNGIHTDYVNIVACVFLIVVLIIPNHKKIDRMVLYYFLTVIPTVLLETAISSQSNIELDIVLFPFAVIIPCLIASSQSDNSNLFILRKSLLSATLFLAGISFLMISFAKNGATTNPSIYNLFVNLIFVAAIPKYVRSTFNLIIDTENNQIVPTIESAEDLAKMQSIFYGIYVMIFAGGLLLILHNVFRKINIIESDQLVYSNYVLLYFCLFLISLFFIFLIGKKKRVSRKPFAIIPFIISYFLLGVSILSFNRVNYNIFRYFSITDYFAFYLVVFCAICFSVVISKGYENNVCKIRGIHVNTFDRIVKLTIFFGVFVNLIICNIIMFSHKSITSLLVTIATLFLSVLVLPGLITYGFAKPPTIEQIVKSTQLEGVIQDGLLFGVEFILIFTVTAFFSINFEAVIPLLADINQYFVEIIEFATSLFLLVTCMNWPLKYCIENNISHFKEREKEVNNNLKTLDNSQSKDLLLMLQKHLKMQNIGSLMISLPYSILTIARIYIKFLISQSDNISSFFVPIEESKSKHDSGKSNVAL